jgi:hypothetical protein
MDDHELEQDLAASKGRRPSFGGSDWLMVLLALAVVGGGAAWWWTHREAPPAVATPSVAAAPPAPAPVQEPVKVVGADQLRELLEAVSVSAPYRKWLSAGEVLERWAVVTDNLAEGVSPRKRLPFLAPQQRFTATRRGDKLVIAAAAYARYDLFAEVVGSVDVAAAVRAYRGLHGPLEAAYRALGYPEGSLDRVTAAALKRLASAPARDGDVVVEAGGTGPDAIYFFVAPELERLGAVDKHLLRMGPRNTRLIQAKARQLERALGFPAAPAAP